jgi:hypothetical protein
MHLAWVDDDEAAADCQGNLLGCLGGFSGR